jgi:hypothetical protein
VDDQLFAVGAGDFKSGVTGDQQKHCVVYTRQTRGGVLLFLPLRFVCRKKWSK